MQDFQRPTRMTKACPVCGEKGKPVQAQTVRAMVSVSLREVEDDNYLFCKTETCPIVYFSSNGVRSFDDEQIREKVYQKQPDSEDVFVCYCFRHTVGEIRTAPSKARTAILDDINQGIRAKQCACDLRNPQGSCCLGNVNGIIKQIEKSVLRA
ncbi:MAG TPA: hypothetical protein VK851_01085 [Anaerolineales bacterium]|nr:hypothetical protein [Anaerolineales bacterium]